MTAATHTSESIHHVNPHWVRRLNLLQVQTEYTGCSGAELHTAHGDVLLDFLSGYCVHTVGPKVPEATEEALGPQRKDLQISWDCLRRTA